MLFHTHEDPQAQKLQPAPASTVVGVVLAGTHHWNDSLFERLALRPLLPIANRPLTGHVLDWLATAGIGKVSLCINSGAEAVRDGLAQDNDALEVSFHEDPQPRGPAGCLRDAVLCSRAETFVVVDGSAIPTIDLALLLRSHRQSGAGLTIVAHRRSERFAQPNGVYVFERSTMEHVPARGFFDIKENLVPALHRAGVAVATFEAQGASPRVLDADTFLAVNQWMVQQVVHRGELAGYQRYGQGLVSDSAHIAADAQIIGPVLVGTDVHIRSGAVVIGPTVLGAGTVVGPNAVVSRAVTWTGARIGARAAVDRSIIAERAIVENRAQIVSTLHVARATESNGLIPTPFRWLRHLEAMRSATATS
jgi:NDP-sugar pyrophosphorylase family protein